jgi:hypothetical protein
MVILIRVKCTLNELEVAKGKEICIQYNKNTLGCLFKCLCKACCAGSRRWESMVDWNQVVPTGEIFKSVGFSNETYGEARPNLIREIIQRLKITQKDSFVDLGSGIGNVVMQVSMDTGCRAVGIEKELGRHQAAVRLLSQCRELQPDVHGRVEFYQQDLMVDDGDIEKVLLRATVVFMNNYSFGEELGLKVLDHFNALQKDAIVVTLKSLFGRRKRRRNSGLLTLEFSFMGPKNGISWSANPIELFVYRKEFSEGNLVAISYCRHISQEMMECYFSVQFETQDSKEKLQRAVSPYHVHWMEIHVHWMEIIATQPANTMCVRLFSINVVAIYMVQNS